MAPAGSRGVSIILLVHDEAGTIADTVARCHALAAGLPGSELIVAEDGSTDGTKEVLEGLRPRLPFTWSGGAARKGYGRALKDALALACAPVVFVCDADGQHDPADFHKLFALIGRCDIVSGFKSPRRDPLYRVWLSRAYNALILSLFGERFRDINSGFKVIRKEVLDSVLPQLADLEHCAMSELMLKAARQGFRIEEVPVSHHSRRYGESLFSPWRLPFIVLSVVQGLARMRLPLGSARPGAAGPP